VFVYNFTTVIERLVQNVLWILPILYVFWPNNRTWYGTEVTTARKESKEYSLADNYDP
jgi:hypothetical protein